MAHGTLRDTIKSLQTTFAADAHALHPLPDELQQTIEAFLERNHKVDENDSQKLHEELLAIHNKHVATSPDKLGAFVHVLRLLQPALRGEKRLEDWWLLVVRPVIDSIGHKRDTIEDAREFLLRILLFDAEEDKSGMSAQLSAKFVNRLMEAYMARSRLPTLASEEISPENEFIAQEIESLLVAFGKKKPLELLTAIDTELVKTDRRLQALSLLSSFVRLQPPHLYLVTETSLISHLHSCILIDLSGTVVDLALTNLIMLLPHIASSLYASMPKLFVIYARILCWDQYSIESTEPVLSEDSSLDEKHSDDDMAAARALEVDADWEPLNRLFNTVEAIQPKANYLFTFLYGLFPLNFMNFIRKPRRYLKMKSYPHADDLNLYQDMIRKRTESHRASHKLHPSFFNSTPEDEVIDNRLLKMDAADLVTECLGLCITVASTLNDPGPPPRAKLPELPREARRPKLSIHPDALLADEDMVLPSPVSPTMDFKSQNSQNSWRNTQSTTLTAFTAPCSSHPDVSFPLPPSVDSRETSPRPLDGSSPPKDGFASRPVSRHKEAKSPRPWKNPPPSDLEPLPKLQVFAQSLSGSPRSSRPSSGNDAYSLTVLQREVMLLKNDLNFERFQKAQYLAQIGQLQRKHIGEATTESQTQSLLNKNRTLADKLKKADDTFAQLKKETVMSRTQAKRNEEQLTQKLKSHREEEKQRQAEIQRLRTELEITKKECDALRQLVIESENQERDARSQLATLSIDLEAMNTLKQRLQELEAKHREHALSDLDVERAREDHELLRTEFESAQLTIQSRDAELDRMRKTYEQKISALESRIRKEKSMLPPSDSPLPDSLQQMVDSALAASNAKYTQIKKNYKRLNERYIELEVRFQELESGAASPLSLRPGSVLSLTKYAEDPKPVALAGNGVSRMHSTRRPHAFSDPHALLEEDLSPDEDAIHTMHRQVSPRNTYATKPRFESYMNARQMPTRGMSPPPLETSSRNNSFAHDFQAPSSQRQSVQALDLSTSSRKVAPGSEVRVHGRGGAQNIGRKSTTSSTSSKEKKSEKPSKTGGFRGLKGIM